MKGFGLVDDIVPEPEGGAHWDYDEAAGILKTHILKALNEVKGLTPEKRIKLRIEKFGKMGHWQEF